MNKYMVERLNKWDLKMNATDNRWTYNPESFVSKTHHISFQYLYWLKIWQGGWREANKRNILAADTPSDDSSIKTANTESSIKIANIYSEGFSIHTILDPSSLIYQRGVEFRIKYGSFYKP